MSLDTRMPPELPESHRTATTENFPVGSWLLPRAARPVVAAYYRFARAADDIADSSSLASEAKLKLLDGMDKTLAGAVVPGSHPGFEYARRVRELFTERALSLDNARHLLEAFRADAVNRRCRNWSDLLLYCRYSAAPVGRFVLELHGERRANIHAADALCSALQILNHLQDCQDDFRDLQRLYIPTDWLDAEGLMPRALLARKSPPPLRAVFDRMLDGVDRLNDTARPLPGSVAQRGLRMEIATIQTVSDRLAAKLRRGDPLAGWVGLSRAQKVGAMLTGIVRGWRA